MVTESRSLIEQAAQQLAPLQRVIALTGAGISAESGVATFRGAGGLWEGQPIEEVATPQAFTRQPARVWDFYHQRRKKLQSIQPNAGHQALAEMETLFPGWALITQNVDRLHQLAGSRLVIELHGDIWTVRCTGCGQYFDRTGEELPPLPTCDRCKALLRPNVVWFGEILPSDALAAAEMATQACQAMLIIGTSSVVQPAASMAYWAKSRGALIIECNIEETSLTSDADFFLSGPAGTTLPQLVEVLRKIRN
ncbi:MAG: NAD-dependent protein deacylase [Phycisphaerae bacterium]|nr:NAD-dependent protein deacylase [Phycisphaerae bacterium]